MIFQLIQQLSCLPADPTIVAVAAIRLLAIAVAATRFPGFTVALVATKQAQQPLLSELFASQRILHLPGQLSVSQLMTRCRRRTVHLPPQSRPSLRHRLRAESASASLCRRTVWYPASRPSHCRCTRVLASSPPLATQQLSSPSSTQAQPLRREEPPA